MRKLVLRISVNIYNSQGGGNLNVEESFEIPETDFFEMSKILGQFHELANKIHAERK